jgi:hypothetical protein
VREAAVLAREDEPGEKRLVAYYTVAEGSPVSAEQLRAQLSRTLASYMVPAAYVRLSWLPLTSNGKLDRKGLPVPELAAYTSREYEPPQGETEEALAGIWREVLRAERVGRRDNFFELGGHSLLAMQVLARIRSSLSIELPVSAVFEQPILIELSARVDQLGQERLLSEIEAGDCDLTEALEAVITMAQNETQTLGAEQVAR